MKEERIEHFIKNFLWIMAILEGRININIGKDVKGFVKVRETIVMEDIGINTYLEFKRTISDRDR